MLVLIETSGGIVYPDLGIGCITSFRGRAFPVVGSIFWRLALLAQFVKAGEIVRFGWLRPCHADLIMPFGNRRIGH